MLWEQTSLIMAAKNKFREDFLKAKIKFPELTESTSPFSKYKYKVSGEFKVIDQEGYLWGTFPAVSYTHLTLPTKA